MNIIVAKSAGYCFGVRDAVNIAYETAEKYGNVYNFNFPFFFRANFLIHSK